MPKILVVDDEAIITLQLEERLSAMGYTVAGMAASGVDGVEKAKRLLPDLVLMDIVMPGKMNGIEAAKIITTELKIPVVFVTAYADDIVVEKAKSVRPYGYIVKPFNELEIKAAIEVALFRRSTEEEERKMHDPSAGNNPSTEVGSIEEDSGLIYLDKPDIKTVLLEDIFTDIILFLYTEQVKKEPIFKFAIEEGMKKGGRNLFAYSQSTLQKFFAKEILKRELYTYKIKKNGSLSLLSVLETAIVVLFTASTVRSSVTV